jgi:thiol-disulfide isomerase/thioredoxin
LRRFSRWIDVAAALLVAFALWKFFVHPRALANAAGAAPVPHAQFDRLGGGTIRVADQRGHLLVLDFFASWCEPCKIEMPLVQRWAVSHPNARVIAVDVAEPPVAAAAFAHRYRLRDVALDPPGDSRGIFQIAGLPTLVVVDPQGRIRARWEGLNPAIGFALDNAEKNLADRRSR